MRTIVAMLLGVFVALLASILAIQVYFLTQLQKDAASDTLFEMLHATQGFGALLWQLVQPVAQLALILLVLVFFFERSGLARRFLDRPASGEGMNTQSVIALIIIGSFAIGALMGTGAAGQLKEIALVVVGFYFGTQRRRDEKDAAEAAPANGQPPAGSGTPGTLAAEPAATERPS